MKWTHTCMEETKRFTVKAEIIIIGSSVEIFYCVAIYVYYTRTFNQSFVDVLFTPNVISCWSVGRSVDSVACAYALHIRLNRHIFTCICAFASRILIKWSYVFWSYSYFTSFHLFQLLYSTHAQPTNHITIYIRTYKNNQVTTVAFAANTLAKWY